MRRFALIATLLLLTACGQDTPPAAEPTKSAIETPPDIPVMGSEVRIMAFGDSLLTGYGLKDGESYPARLESALRARGVNARIANAGVSGDTTADGLQRLAFALDSQDRAPDLVLISLGGNDMLRALPPAQTRQNLDAMLTLLHERGVKVLLLGMLAAPNLGKDYAAQFNSIYPELAKKHGASLVPFFMQPLMERPELVQKDKVHPTEQGIEEMVAQTIDQVTAALPKAN